MTFDPKRHVIKVQGGREYLPVSARLVWFRQEHPDWGIETRPVEINMEKQYAIFSCSITNAEGKVMATATKMENIRGFGDWLEKSETGAVGRALAYCGYGTQFAPELEEGDRLADAPYPVGGPTNGSSSRYGSGNGRAPMNGSGMNGGGGNGTVNRPAPAGRPAPATGGITRVAEPEREYADPGGEGDDDDEEPFFEEMETAAPAPSSAPRAASARPASSETMEPAAPAKPNLLAGNRCTVDGCSNVLTNGQMTISMNKFGRPVCLLHQKEVQPLAAASSGR